MTTPVKNNQTTPTNSPLKEVPAAPKKEAKGAFNNARVSSVRRNLMEDFGTEPKRRKLTIDWSITVLRSKDVPNAAFGQYWGE